jgi:hypothetical protein
MGRPLAALCEKGSRSAKVLVDLHPVVTAKPYAEGNLP